MKTVLITGANSGIGKALVVKYAQEGYSVILACRDESRARDTVDEIARLVPKAKLKIIQLDLSSFQSVNNSVKELLVRKEQIDILIMNAGIHIPYRAVMTEDNQEVQYQTNFLSPLLFILNVLCSDAGRSVTQLIYVSSNAHHVARFPLPLLFGFWYRYALSKFDGTAAFLLLHKRFPQLDVRVISPGAVQTNVHRNKPILFQIMGRFIGKKISAQATAEYFYRIGTTSYEGVGYWSLGKPALPHPICLDEGYQLEVWNRAMKYLMRYLPVAYALAPVANFPKNFNGTSYRQVSPRSIEAIVRLVKEARAKGERVHVIGKAHSYNDIFFTPQHLISLKHFKKLSLDMKRKSLICGAGVTINEVSAYLDTRGLTLPYAGSFGGQTLVGALSTGTHGYYRHGGGLGELVRKVTLVDGTGRVHKITNETDLSALRCNLGTLGIITELVISVTEKDMATYQIRALEKKQFFGSLTQLCAAHDHLRFVMNPFNNDLFMTIIIDHIKPRVLDQKAKAPQYLSDRKFPNFILAIFRWLLQRGVIQSLIRAGLSTRTITQNSIVPFSAYLFTKNGVVDRHVFLSQLLHEVFNNPDCLNMSLAISPKDLRDFDLLFHEIRGRYPTVGNINYSMRFLGSSEKILLASNYRKDVIVIDIQVNKNNEFAEPFLKELEAVAMGRFKARMHWGKVFYSQEDSIRTLWPSNSFSRFNEVKRRYDPDGVFSNPYSLRVLGI